MWPWVAWTSTAEADPEGTENCRLCADHASHNWTSSLSWKGVWVCMSMTTLGCCRRNRKWRGNFYFKLGVISDLRDPDLVQILAQTCCSLVVWPRASLCLSPDLSFPPAKVREPYRSWSQPPSKALPSSKLPGLGRLFCLLWWVELSIFAFGWGYLSLAVQSKLEYPPENNVLNGTTENLLWLLSG